MSTSPPPLSRTSSLPAEKFASEVKRTRKRFAKWQITALEKLYATSTHPTREEREKLAEYIEAELRAVTVWFQNKRQVNRKSTFGSATNRKALAPAASTKAPAQRPTTIHSSAHISAHSLSASVSSGPSRSLKRTASGFSLDHIASRSELMPRTPRKLSRHRSLITSNTYHSSGSLDLLDAMPSSPIQDDSPVRPGVSGSPSTRDLLEFASNRGYKGSSRSMRTLEWACAAARVAPGIANGEDDSISIPFPLPSISRIIDNTRNEPCLSENEDDYDVKTDIVDEDEEDAKTEIVETEAESIFDCHEAITPQPSLTFSSRASSPLARSSLDTTPVSASSNYVLKQAGSGTETVSRKPTSKDNEMMSAAWALCGLQKASRN